MVLAYLGLNIGVMAVAIALTNTTTIGAGFGLGLFGTLSIIRLRSLELTHQDVAYYFAALALGLIGGIEIDPAWLAVALPATILAAILVGDHPVLFRSYRQQVMVLDPGHRAAGRGAKAGIDSETSRSPNEITGDSKPMFRCRLPRRALIRDVHEQLSRDLGC